MSEVNNLLDAYEDILKMPWKENLSGAEKVWFAIYEPSNERRIRFRLPEFELKTQEHGYQWGNVDITQSFANWMAGVDYREAYFSNPQDMDPLLEEYSEFVSSKIHVELDQADSHTVVSIIGISSLFGITHASKVIENITSRIPGRLLVFFPGRYDGSMYRLLDARDGWNYLAVPITAK